MPQLSRAPEGGPVATDTGAPPEGAAAAPRATGDDDAAGVVVSPDGSGPRRPGVSPGDASAYGGPGWTPRTAALRQEIGGLWAACGVDSEWRALRAVLLHRPGPELEGLADPDRHLMLDVPDPARVRDEHDALAAAYREAGVRVDHVAPAATPAPNQMFAADLMFMTPSGAVVGRPASTVRAGEERWIARRLADLGVPILRTVAGTGTFEGADACWLDPATVLVGRGLRTNPEGAAQVAATLAEQGVGTLQVDLAHGSMHLMGDLRILDRDLAFVRAGRLSWRAVQALQARGVEIRFFAAEEEIRRGFGHNVVVLGPRRVLMPAGNPDSLGRYRAAGVECVTVEVGELAKAAGSVGCLTGIVEREPEGHGPTTSGG